MSPAHSTSSPTASGKPCSAGANRWQNFSTWPPKKTRALTLHLDSTQSLMGGRHAGSLSDVVSKSDHVDRFTYDPKNPGQNPFGRGGSTKTSVSRSRNDVLYYQTGPLPEALTVVGPGELELHFSTNVKDTDFFAAVVVVSRGGTKRLLTEPGLMRMRYLSGWRTPSLLKPGLVYRAQIPLNPIAHRFEKGQRLGLILRSDYFPAYARNANTGGAIASDTETVVAHQQIHHNSPHPSALHLRVLHEEPQ